MDITRDQKLKRKKDKSGLAKSSPDNPITDIIPNDPETDELLADVYKIIPDLEYLPEYDHDDPEFIAWIEGRRPGSKRTYKGRTWEQIRDIVEKIWEEEKKKDQKIK